MQDIGYLYDLAFFTKYESISEDRKHALDEQNLCLSFLSTSNIHRLIPKIDGMFRMYRIMLQMTRNTIYCGTSHICIFEQLIFPLA